MSAFRLPNQWVFSLWSTNRDCSFLHDQGVTQPTLSWQMNAVRQDWLARHMCEWCVFWWGIFRLSCVCVSLLTPCLKKSIRVSVSKTFCFTFLFSLILKFLSFLINFHFKFSSFSPVLLGSLHMQRGRTGSLLMLKQLCRGVLIKLSVAILIEINWQGHWTAPATVDGKRGKKDGGEAKGRGEHRKQQQWRHHQKLRPNYSAYKVQALTWCLQW